MSALNPDVAVIHAQQADRAGNVQLWGISGVQKEAVLAARPLWSPWRSSSTSFEPHPGAVVLPALGDRLCRLMSRAGLSPSYAHSYSVRDNDFYVAWDAISRDRDTFLEWMEANVLGA